MTNKKSRHTLQRSSRNFLNEICYQYKIVGPRGCTSLSNLVHIKCQTVDIFPSKAEYSPLAQQSLKLQKISLEKLANSVQNLHFIALRIEFSAKMEEYLQCMKTLRTQMNGTHLSNLQNYQPSDFFINLGLFYFGRNCLLKSVNYVHVLFNFVSRCVQCARGD